MDRENILDKYNVSVKPVVSQTINQDLIKFNLKSRNAIYNQIIIRTYEFYRCNREKKVKNIKSVLNNNLIECDKAESVAIQLVDKEIISDKNTNIIKHKKEVLPIKVSANAVQIIETILNDIDDDNVAINNSKHKLKNVNKDNGSDGCKVSECLRQIFTFYASLPACERETLMFADKLSIILEAINNNVTIEVVGIKENVNFCFKPVAISSDASHQNAYVVGVIDCRDNLSSNRYQLYSIKVNELANYRIRKGKCDLCFDKEYVLTKYANVVDDEFINIFNKFNMIIDLVSKYDFKFDYINDAYILKVEKMTKKDRDYYRKVYNYKIDDVISIPSRFMNSIISIPVKLCFMLRHDPGYAYSIEEKGLVKVRYNDKKIDDNCGCFLNKLEVIREVRENEVIYETTLEQAEEYFKCLGGVTILQPKELRDVLVAWHKSTIEDLENNR